jgi:serine/threonine protein kinase
VLPFENLMSLPSREGELALGRYRLTRRIGRGTFGEVYVAESLNVQATSGQREVVLKVLHSQWARVPEVVERFRREAAVTRRIVSGPQRHPHIAEIYEYGQLDDGVPFIAMEHLPGHSLRDELVRGRPPFAEGLKLLIGIAEALAAAHRAGVVHRDLKPENIPLVDRDGDPRYPVVLDFGIAKFLDSAEKLTMTGTLLGTPQYMSPEQFRGESNIGPGADVYAFGVLAFEVLAGHMPIEGRSFAELAVAHTSAPPSRLLVEGGSPALSDLIGRCLEKEPGKRPSSNALVENLRGISRGVPPSHLADTAVDPFATTGRVAEDVKGAVARSQAQQQTELAAQRQKNVLTVLLAVAVFILTGAIGLAAYFFLR